MDFCGEARIFKEHLALVERADAFWRLYHAGRFERALQLAASTVNGQGRACGFVRGGNRRCGPVAKATVLAARFSRAWRHALPPFSRRAFSRARASALRFLRRDRPSLRRGKPTLKSPDSCRKLVSHLW